MGVVAAKQRRQSVSAMLFGAQKESSFLIPSLLVLKQVVGGKGPKDSVKVVELTLQLAGGKPVTASTPPVLPSLVNSLFGGPVLNMNTLNAKESEAMMTAAAQARRADAAAAAAAAAAGPGGDHRRGPSGGPPPLAVPSAGEGEEEAARVIEDAEATIREIRTAHPPSPQKQISTFFTVVSARWLKQRQAQESAVAASALAAKDKGAKKVRKSGAVTDAPAVGEEETAAASAADSASQLVAISGPLQPALMVRWDVERRLCALVQTGSPSTVTVLRLVSAAPTAEDHGVAQLSMEPLCAVQLGFPSAPHRSLTSLTWHAGALLTTTSDHAAVRVTLFSPLAGWNKAGHTGPESDVFVTDTFELPTSSPVMILSTLLLHCSVA